MIHYAVFRHFKICHFHICITSMLQTGLSSPIRSPYHTERWLPYLPVATCNILRKPRSPSSVMTLHHHHIPEDPKLHQHCCGDPRTAQVSTPTLHASQIKGKMPLYGTKHIGEAEVWLHSFFNILNTKRNLLYIKSQFVPRSKHFPPRL